MFLYGNTIATARVSSKLDYCNSIFHNISLNDINKLQRVHNCVLKESSNLRHIYRNKCRVYTTYNDTANNIIRYTGIKLSHFEVEVL